MRPALIVAAAILLAATIIGASILHIHGEDAARRDAEACSRYQADLMAGLTSRDSHERTRASFLTPPPGCAAP